MSNVIQHTVVDGLPDVAHWPLRIGRSNNFMWARRVLIGGQDADLPPRHLLFVNIDGLKGDKHWLKTPGWQKTHRKWYKETQAESSVRQKQQSSELQTDANANMLTLSS